MRAQRKQGVATLPTVILISIMALVIAVGLTTLSFTELMVSQGSSQSSRALFYAEAGARDALIRIARDKNFATSSYSIDFTTGGTGCSPSWGGCATVSVSSTTPKIATSTGAMGASTRTIQVSITVDSNGQIATSSAQTVWSEI